MPKFVFDKIKSLKSNQFKLFQLSIDGKRQLDLFEEELRGTDYEKEYRRLFTWFDYYSETGRLANGIIKELNVSSKDEIKEYEFRTTNLRIYAIKGDTGKIIILCGFKKNQKSDLKTFKSLKKQILSQPNKL